MYLFEKRKKAPIISLIGHVETATVSLKRQVKKSHFKDTKQGQSNAFRYSFAYF